MAAAVAFGIATATAQAASVTFSFGAAPAASKKAAARSYFSFTAAPGQSVHDALVVKNLSSTSQTLAISPAFGATARISGYSYVGAFTRCHGTACWIHDLPVSVRVPANGRLIVPFTVKVPAGTRDQQYLAGISVQPAKPPKPTSVGSIGGIGASAAVVTRVNVGLAVTVGNLSSLRSQLDVERVAAVYTSTTPTLLVQERNTGQTFLSAKGTAVCIDRAARHTYPVISATVLPRESAVLRVNAQGLRAGAAVRCTVSLRYGKGTASPAMWRGSVKLPSTRPKKFVQTGPHIYAQVPKPRIPRWAIGVIAGGALLVVVLLATVVVLLLRRRSSPAPPLA